MFKLFSKKSVSRTILSPLTWDQTAAQALAKALNQTPVPAALKGTVKKQLTLAAEKQARQAGHSTVTAEDLMQGLLAKLPASVRAQVEQASRQGPDGPSRLENELRQ